METTARYDRRQRDRDLGRATKFLSALSQSPEIRRLLATGAGYTEDDHQRGWNLALQVFGYGGSQPTPAPTRPVAQEAAIAELDQWDGPAFERTRAALAAPFPEQLNFIFDGLNAAQGADAVASVKTFLDRIAVLREGSDPKRTAFRDADRAAAERLARRLIVTPETEAHFRALIEQATKLAPLPSTDPDVTETPEYQSAALALNAWLEDWRGQARALIRRRDYLIRLGLAGRRTRPDGEEDGEEEDVEEVEATAAPGVAS